MKSIKKLFSRAAEGQFAKDTLLLTVGTVIAQLIPLLASLALARLFDENDFGRFSVFMSAMSIITVVIALKYEMAIIPAKNKSTAVNVMVLSFLLSLAMGVLCLLVLFIAKTPLLKMLELEEFPYLLFLLPCSAIFYEIYTCFNEWCVRNRSFKQLSVSKIFNTLFIAVTSIILGLFGIKAVGLLYGQLIGQLLIVVYVLISFFYRDKNELKRVSKRRLQTVLVKNRSYPAYLIPSQLLNTFFGQLPVLLITASFGVGIVGFFSFAIRILSTPVTMIATAIGDVFRKRIQADRDTIGNSKVLFLKLLVVLFVIGAVGFLILGIFAPFLFKLVFGERWYVSGVYVQFLVVGEFINFVASPFTGVYYIYNKKHVLLIWQIVYSVLTFLSIFLGCVVFKDIYITLLLYCVARVLINLLSLVLTFSIAKKGIGNKTVVQPI